MFQERLRVLEEVLDALISSEPFERLLASRDRPVAKLTGDILPCTWVAFAFAVATGVLLFSAKATGYAGNFFFRGSHHGFDRLFVLLSKVAEEWIGFAGQHHERIS